PAKKGLNSCATAFMAWPLSATYRASLSREQKLDLQPQRPVVGRIILRLNGVVERLGQQVHRQLADTDQPAEPTSHRYGPDIVVVVGLPVGGDDLRARDIPATAEVVVHE